jgi:hypothetical protein
MSKVAAIAASLKAVLLIAAGAFARGDMLPVILISAMFELGLQIRHKPDRREATYIGREAIEISEAEPPGQARKPDRLAPDR